jgi:F0F1-type ATP synthase assembly protein I
MEEPRQQGAESESNQRKFWLAVGRYSSLAFLLPSSVFIGYALGYFIDNRFGTEFGKVTGLLLGVAAGMVQLVRQALKDPNGKPGGS